MKITVITSLYKCEKYLEGFFLAVDQIINKNECEFLLLHNAPQENELEIIKKNIKDKNWFRHIIIEQREGLYTTWNRGIKMSNGEYCTVWNVDDIRFPDSIFSQAKALDENPLTAIAYGDIFMSVKYGEKSEKLYKFPEWIDNREEFYKSYLMSCFQMWRKAIHRDIGYYDEQFKCVGDFDFQIRSALKYPFTKVQNPLGIYLEGQQDKLSYSGLQTIENCMVYMRYGVYEKIELFYLFKSLSLYKNKYYLFFGEWHKNSLKSPISKIYRLKGIFISIFKFPLQVTKIFLKMIIK